ncbi:MAG: hypothetical protein IJ848_00045 [Alphaproteobacteria bacterium]|nr:hypothetical protein [Alphaproteobacteria bacterium]
MIYSMEDKNSSTYINNYNHNEYSNDKISWNSLDKILQSFKNNEPLDNN